MSGIVGAFYFDKAQRIDPTKVQASLDALAPWGGDGGNVVSVAGCAIGQARRALDEPDGDGSPLWDSERRLVAVFDGALRGTAALRATLEDAGFRFRGTTSAELVVAAYRHWGVDCVDHLTGAFAFAVYDRKSHTLFLARDRLGARPLYVYRDAEQLLFGSGVQAILPHGVPRVLDPHAIADYLTFGFVPGPRTLLREVNALPPGSATYTERTRVRSWSYWKPTFAPDRSKNLEQQAQALLSAIEHAIAPGADLIALSGGLGSAAVSAIAARGAPAPQLITVGRQGAPDARAAAETAGSLSVAHDTVDAAPIDEGAWSALIKDGDFPVDADAMAWLSIARALRSKGDSALTGVGSDIVFGAGLRYRAVLRAHELRARLISKIAVGSIAPASVVEPIAARFAHSIADGAHRAWLRTDFKRGLRGYDPAREWRRSSDGENLEPLAELQQIDLVATVPALLAQLERVERHSGIRLSHPLLDAEVVDLVTVLPTRYRLDVDHDRVVLQRAARRVLPPQVVQRASMPVGATPADWLSGPLRAVVQEQIFGASSSGLFEPNALRKAWYRLMLGGERVAVGLWRVAALEAWAHHHTTSPGDR